MSNNPILILGPTAAGKTDYAINMAKAFPSEIISVDSALIYRGMDIGTAKPTLEERQGILHHIIDICEVRESYSVAQFCEDAHRLIEQIQVKGKTPILVGGTMMYFNALINGLSDLPEVDERIRSSLRSKLIESGVKVLHGELKKVDPVSGNRLKPTDSQRILRALEVYQQTQRPIHAFWSCAKWRLEKPYELKIVNPTSRAQLHQRIAQRAQSMLDKGFIDEVRQFYEQGDLTADFPSMRCVGYRQVWQYFEGEIKQQDLLERMVVATRQLAKRQITWLKRFEQI